MPQDARGSILPASQVFPVLGLGPKVSGPSKGRFTFEDRFPFSGRTGFSTFGYWRDEVARFVDQKILETRLWATLGGWEKTLKSMSPGDWEKILNVQSLLTGVKSTFSRGYAKRPLFQLAVESTCFGREINPRWLSGTLRARLDPASAALQRWEAGIHKEIMDRRTEIERDGDARTRWLLRNHRDLGRINE